MTVLALPAIRNPGTEDFWPLGNTLTNTSPLTKDQQTVELPGVLWRCHFGWQDLEEPEWRLLTAWLAQMRGSGRANIGPPHAPFPQGQAAPDDFLFDDDTDFDDGTDFFDEPHEVAIRADATSSKILFRTEGWGASETVLKTGDFISWANGDRRMMGILATDAVSDADGNADLSLAFPAPEIPVAGVRIYAWWPSVTMRLTDDNQAQTSWQPPVLASQSIDMIEAAP
jgi:hypothetical protein